MGVLSLLAIPRMWRRSLEEWTETAGVIAESYVDAGTRLDRVADERNRRKSGTHRVESEHATYRVRIKYRYTIAGQDYAGDAPALHQPENDEDAQQAKSILPRYPAGDGLAVFHHPDKLDQSRLTLKEAAHEFGVDVAFAIAFLLVGIGLISFGRWISRRTASPRG